MTTSKDLCLTDYNQGKEAQLEKQKDALQKMAIPYYLIKSSHE